MYIFAAALALAAGSDALVSRAAQCCFGLTSSGAASGSVGQLSDGQNRIGGGLPAASYCISSTGAITDEQGRGCILTAPTTQFQCDTGATAQSGFSISPSGALSYNGNSSFYECPTGDNGEDNIFAVQMTSNTQCQKISLQASGCYNQQAASHFQYPNSTTVATSQATPSVKYNNATSIATSQAVSTAKYTNVTVVATSQATSSISVANSTKTVTSQVTVLVSGHAVTSSTASPSSNEAVSSSGASQEVTVPAAFSSAAITSSGKKSEISSASSEVSSSKASSPTASAASSEVSSSPAASPASSKPASPTSTGCPTSLNGQYEFPHLIVPIDSTNADSAAGTSYNGKIDNTTTSLFNFDIPSTYSGQTCSLIFLFPEQSELETSSYNISGSGMVDICALDEIATLDTTYYNSPKCKQSLGNQTFQPGHSYDIATFECPAGQAIAFGISAGAGSDTSLEYFQDFNPSPIGLYITVC